MSDSFSLTLKEIAHRLHIGESTLHVWRNRYKEWIPRGEGSVSDRYTPDMLDVFRLIARCTHAGFENQEIERILESMYGRNTGGNPENDESTECVNGRRAEKMATHDEKAEGGLKDVLSSLQVLMKNMATQQERIAEAQERRAAAQERMAFAMESRAENELVNTEVMRELVGAIQDMSMKNSVSSLMERVKNISCPSPAELEDFSHDMGFDMDNLEELTETTLDGGENRQSSFDFDETSGVYHSYPDSSTEAGDTENTLAGPVKNHPDDFSIDIESYGMEMSRTVDDLVKPEETMSSGHMDDLSVLLEPEDLKTAGDMDDLTALLEPEDLTAAASMDDLTALLEPEDLTAAASMDDLSALLEPEDLKAAGDMDDLSMLLEPEDKTPSDMDDLSQLIDDEPRPNLAAPSSSEPVKPVEKKNAPVDENYKSRILKRIILMKQKEKRSVEDVVRLFNEEGVKTFSGKDTWDVRTIQGIFKYIDSFS